MATLKEDPSEAIWARYGPQSYPVRVVFSNPDDLPILIPTRTPDVEAAIASDRENEGGNEPAGRTQKQVVSDLVQRAWTDSSFRSTLLANPRETLDRLLLPIHGRRLDAAIDPRVHIEQEGECCIVVPPVQRLDKDPLSEDDLEQVAGGGVGVIITAGLVSLAITASAGAVGDDGGE